jgi:hypothetical protein
MPEKEGDEDGSEMPSTAKCIQGQEHRRPRLYGAGDVPPTVSDMEPAAQTGMVRRFHQPADERDGNRKDENLCFEKEPGIKGLHKNPRKQKDSNIEIPSASFIY